MFFTEKVMKVEERNSMKDEDMKEMVPLLISMLFFFLLVGRTINLFYHTSLYSLPQYECVESQRQTGPGAHPASCKMNTGSFLEVKCGRGVLLTTHPLLVQRSWKSRAITLPTLWTTPGL